MSIFCFYSSYEPELHPGVTYKLYNPKATLKIFSTGGVTITGEGTAFICSLFPLSNRWVDGVSQLATWQRKLLSCSYRIDGHIKLLNLNVLNWICVSNTGWDNWIHQKPFCRRPSADSFIDMNNYGYLGTLATSDRQINHYNLPVLTV